MSRVTLLLENVSVVFVSRDAFQKDKTESNKYNGCANESFAVIVLPLAVSFEVAGTVALSGCLMWNGLFKKNDLCD